MLREFLISVYLLVYKIIFQVSKLASLQRKTTFVMSFSGNMEQVVHSLSNNLHSEEIIIIRPRKQAYQLQHLENVRIFHLNKPTQFIQSVYHLATSRYVLIDNYYGFLSVSNFKQQVKCVQLWHAVGAMKQFGLEDQSNKTRSHKAIKRFQAVYDRFHYIIVGSRKMEAIFKNSFGVEDDTRFLRTGIPRTDIFFDDIQKQRELQKFKRDFPMIGNKKVILYAPTYRENELNNDTVSLQINLDKMYQQLHLDYVLLLRLHPALDQHFKNKYPSFIYHVSDYDSINTLMIGADILITDYSSIPFEFALLKKPIIFYAYDFDVYTKARGLVADYAESVPGPLVYSTEEIITAVQQNKLQTEKLEPFAKQWNEYSKGNATNNLLEVLYELPIETQTERIREHV